MNIWVRSRFFVAAGAFIAFSAVAQAAETRLAGIRLYDSGVDVVRKLGSPNEVLPISVSVTEAGGGQGGGGNPSGGSRGGGKFAGAPGGGSSNFAVPPLSLNQAKGGSLGHGPPDVSGPTPVGGPTPMGGPSGGGGSMGSTNVTFVRWVYRRGAGGSVNVVLNNHNKVVQIEAIGVSNGNVRTAKGVTLGSSMATVMRLYQTPDSYEIGGNYFMVRFLQKHRVAFRLTREDDKAPYRVTGIVVSAGKQ